MKAVAKLFSLTSRLKNSTKGFTMIELLIVIAILGILAVAVLAAINPVEQINRGRDTGSKNDAEQLIGALDRFNAFRGYAAWVDTPQADFETQAAPLESKSDWFVQVGGVDGDCPVLDRLSMGNETSSDECKGTDELKSAYIDKITKPDYNHLYVFNSGIPGGSTYVCFNPISKSFQTEAHDRCLGGAENLPDDYPFADTCDVTVNGKNNQDLVCLP